MQQFHRLKRGKAITRTQELDHLQVDSILEQQHKDLEERCLRLQQEAVQQEEAELSEWLMKK